MTLKVHEQVTKELLPTITAEFPTPARRPLFSALNCELFFKTFGLQMPVWQDRIKVGDGFLNYRYSNPLDSVSKNTRNIMYDRFCVYTVFSASTIQVAEKEQVVQILPLREAESKQIVQAITTCQLVESLSRSSKDVAQLAEIQGGVCGNISTFPAAGGLASVTAKKTFLVYHWLSYRCLNFYCPVIINYQLIDCACQNGISP